jgi:hypothetical protein
LLLGKIIVSGSGEVDEDEDGDRDSDSNSLRLAFQDCLECPTPTRTSTALAAERCYHSTPTPTPGSSLHVLPGISKGGDYNHYHPTATINLKGTNGEEMMDIGFRSMEVKASSPDPVQDRWAGIRKNAAERAARISERTDDEVEESSLRSRFTVACCAVLFL